MQPAFPFVDVSTPIDLLQTMITLQNPAVLVRDFKTDKTFIITRSDLDTRAVMLVIGMSLVIEVARIRRRCDAGRKSVARAAGEAARLQGGPRRVRSRGEGDSAAAARRACPKAAEHSLWQLVEHLRIAQADILEFCLTAKYKAKKWPDDYWPKSPGPRNAAAWTKAIARYRRDRKALQRLAANPNDRSARGDSARHRPDLSARDPARRRPQRVSHRPDRRAAPAPRDLAVVPAAEARTRSLARRSAARGERRHAIARTTAASPQRLAGPGSLRPRTS